MSTESKLKIIQSALEVALDKTFVVNVRADHATGYIADARLQFSTPKDEYFFSYGNTKKAAMKDLAAQVEEFLRIRLDKCRTGLNTLAR